MIGIIIKGISFGLILSVAIGPVFFASILATIFTLDITKAYLANKLRKWVTPKIMQIMYLIVGLALIAFGVHLIFYNNK